MSKAVVMLMSGGIESAVVAAMISCTTSGYYGEVRRALMVNYGQRAWEKEYKSAVYLCNKYGIFLETVVVDFPFLEGNSLVAHDLVATHSSEGAERGHIVPYRNLIFLGIAASYIAATYDGDEDASVALVTGFDYDPNNPGSAMDKSPEFAASFEETLEMSREGPKVELYSPLNFAPVGKAANIRRALNLGVDLSKTWSCYNDGRLHCGGCGSCVIRQHAFLELGLEDLAGVLPLDECESVIAEVRERLLYGV